MANKEGFFVEIVNSLNHNWFFQDVRLYLQLEIR